MTSVYPIHVAEIKEGKRNKDVSPGKMEPERLLLCAVTATAMNAKLLQPPQPTMYTPKQDGESSI